MMSSLHVLIVILFGVIFISSIWNEPVPAEPVAWWYEMLWSMFAVLFGTLVAVYAKRFNERNRQLFLKMYEKTKFPLFKLQAEVTAKPYMYPFARAMGILFVVIGLSIFIRNLF